jgi:carbamoyl-phosphate synthase small subunit
LLGRKPLFAICLGHQLVGLAMGAKTYKMKFGHRGIHHPVMELDQNGKQLRTWITSQNHGFAVDRDSLPDGARVSFVHADDGSVEGLSVPKFRCETVQFHPEAAPGPVESSILLARFMERMNEESSSLQA